MLSGNLIATRYLGTWGRVMMRREPEILHGYGEIKMKNIFDIIIFLFCTFHAADEWLRYFLSFVHFFLLFCFIFFIFGPSLLSRELQTKVSFPLDRDRLEGNRRRERERERDFRSCSWQKDDKKRTGGRSEQCNGWRSLMALDGCQIATVSAARGCTRFSFLPARHWKPCAPTDLLVLSRRLKCVRYILHPLFSWQFSNHPSEPFREISSEKLARKRYFKYTYTQSILKSCIVFFSFFFTGICLHLLDLLEFQMSRFTHSIGNSNVKILQT